MNIFGARNKTSAESFDSPPRMSEIRSRRVSFDNLAAFLARNEFPSFAGNVCDLLIFCRARTQENKITGGALLKNNLLRHNSKSAQSARQEKSRERMHEKSRD